MTKPVHKQKTQKNETINDQSRWDTLQKNWAQEQAQRVGTYALRYFDTDEDLSLSRHMLFVFITLFFVAAIIWANFARLDEITRGEGKIIPSSELQTLQSLEAGIVQEFLVHEGDTVKQGQVLVRLSDVQASSDLGANRARYLGLLASIARLQAEAEGKETVIFPEDVIKNAPGNVTEEMNAFHANRQQMQSQINIFQQQLVQREQEVRELTGRISDMHGVINLQQQEKDMIAPLVERGSAPKMELLQLERSLKERETELNGLESSLPRAQAAIEEAQARIKDIRSAAQAQAQSELAVKVIEMNEIRERLAALTERKTRTEIKSPVNGTIQELKVNTVGGVVNSGEDLIKIVPTDDQLVVEARVRPADIAFLYPGQRAIIKLTAYDFSIYGALKGELVNISADTIQDEQGNSFYRVRLRTDDPELKYKGQVLPIIPGMVASVDILTGEKTVMQYLLKPLIKTLDQAMTER